VLLSACFICLEQRGDSQQLAEHFRGDVPREVSAKADFCKDSHSETETEEEL